MSNNTHTALIEVVDNDDTLRADSAFLTGRDEDYLVSLMEEACPIVRRAQFFLWARGALQSLIPHDILVCGYGDWNRRIISVDKFASKPFPDRLYGELCNTEDGLMIQAHAVWESAGHRPVQVPGNQVSACAQLYAILQRHGIENCILHGVPQINGTLAPFYCFVGLPQPLTQRMVHLIEIVMPTIYAAHMRLLHGERRRSEPKLVHTPTRYRVTNVKAKSITERQVQVLQWVQDGKSNREIADALQLSPLTVKNHIQNILKKLKVRNRAQAVSCAIGLRLIKSNSDGNVAHATVARTAQPRVVP